MSSDTAIHIRLKINFPVILIAVLFIHAFLMTLHYLPNATKKLADNDAPLKLNIRRVKTPGINHPLIRPMESVMNNGGVKSTSSPSPSPVKHAQSPSQPKSPVSLKDLALAKSFEVPTPRDARPVTKTQRPGTRPEVTRQKLKEMNAISLKSEEFKSYSKAIPSGGLSISDMMSGAQKISDAVVSIEVPDGIKPDELNEYELKFYSFQRRTAMNYINSILKNLDRFQKSHPNYQLPENGRIVMTARISYDTEGNVKQIKMIRWTHVNEMQGLFEDIVKGIDQLHNPPKELWERDGEFAMFYTLEILNG